MSLPTVVVTPDRERAGRFKLLCVEVQCSTFALAQRCEDGWRRCKDGPAFGSFLELVDDAMVSRGLPDYLIDFGTCAEAIL